MKRLIYALIAALLVISFCSSAIPAGYPEEPLQPDWNRLLGPDSILITASEVPVVPETPDPVAVEFFPEAKLVALSFDDGPHSIYTAELLAILKREEVKASFFVLGGRVTANAELLRDMAEAGHQIGNHSYSHRRLTSLSAEDRAFEIHGTAELLESITGAKPDALRPPYGEYNEMLKNEAGCPLILWSVDPRDWQSRNAEAVYQAVIRSVGDGDIVLMHDIYPTTVQAVERIIPELKAQGYRLVTVEELIQARGAGNESGVYWRLSPKS